MGMKGGIGYNGLRCKRLSLTLTALICTTILLWQWEKTPLFTVLSPQNQLEILSPVVVDGVQTLDHETDNEEDVKIKAVEKETKAEQGERNTEEHLNEPKVKTRNDEAKYSGAVPMGFETTRSPEKRDDGLTPPFLEKDSRWPLYSGFDCKQWLSGPWSCRLTQRTDFSYKCFRWQPENCEMPDFDGSTFLKRSLRQAICVLFSKRRCIHLYCFGLNISSVKIVSLNGSRERERTCPLCRALVKPADLRSFSDGSTSLLFQLF